MDIALVIAIAVLTLVNLATVALNLKLYTEYFKDRSIGRRN